MSTLTPVFPECPGYGFTAQPQYLVNIVRRDGGYERSDRRWSRPLNTYNAVPMGPRDEAVIQNILYFWHAMGGMATVFAFKDWTDYKSCPTWGTPAATDCPLVAVSLDSGTAYQLTKEYTVGALHGFREIYKPVGSTILVANADGDAQTDWLVDQDTGLLKPGGSFVGTPTTWGGEFNIPVRFNSNLAAQIADKQMQSAEFSLCEKRLTEPTEFNGDSGGGGDGIVFTESIEIDNGFYGLLVSNGGTLVAADALNDIVYSTDDGGSWTIGLSQATSNMDYSAKAASFGNGKFMFGGGDTSGNSIMFSSTDGISWTPVTVPNIGPLNGIVYGAGNHWLATSGALSGNNCMLSSNNGVTWTAATAAGVDQFYGNPMYYTGGTFAAIGAALSSGGLVLTSTDDGATWTATPFTQDDFGMTVQPPAWIFDGTNFIAGGSSGVTFDPAVLIASDAISLTTAAIRSLAGVMPASDSVAALVKGGGTYVAFGNTNGVHEVASSTNTIVWIQGNNGTGDPTDQVQGGQPNVAYDATNNKIVAIMGAHIIGVTPP